MNGDACGRFLAPNTPGIVTQPRDWSVAVDAVATFRVEATGPPWLTYQWQRNGVNLSGAANSAEAALTLQGPSLDFQDAFANRNVINGDNAFGGFGGGTNNSATKESGEPNYAGKTGGASVWYG